VRVLSVQLRDFRTYSRAEVALGVGLTVVYGPNGAGKSNLLEAIYFGCCGRSPRTRNERELVRFGQGATRVTVRLAEDDPSPDREGTPAQAPASSSYAREREHELSVGFQPGEPKHMSADGAPVQRLLDVAARPLVSVFMPDRLDLVKGTPSVRRAHLDQVVAAFWPARAQERRAYAQVLAQRNALLGRIRAGAGTRASIATWDRQLAKHAIALRETRAGATALLAESFSERAAQLGLEGEVRLEYRPRTGASDEEMFVAELEERLEADLQRGFSGYGPHRDELALLRDGRLLGSYGSQGEQRLALLALLLAERSALADERGQMPLMLLDDVMSELDAQRRELLARDLESGGQSVIATTDLAHVPGASRPSVARLRVSPGAVLREAPVEIAGLQEAAAGREQSRAQASAA
jgi:DNA replication and repair protein RecF